MFHGILPYRCYISMPGNIVIRYTMIFHLLCGERVHVRMGTRRNTWEDEPTLERQMESALISRLVQPCSNVELFTITGSSLSCVSSVLRSDAAFPRRQKFSNVTYAKSRTCDTVARLRPKKSTVSSFGKVYDRILIERNNAALAYLPPAGQNSRKRREKAMHASTMYASVMAGNLQRRRKRFGGEELRCRGCLWIELQRRTVSRISLCNTRAAGPSSFSSLDGL